MRYFLNDVEIPYGPFVSEDIQYPVDVLRLWSDEELAEINVRREYIEPTLSVEQICGLIDAERDRRIAMDFSHDFGETPAHDDHGNTFPAHTRLLQMRQEDRFNWQTLQGAALTALVSGNATAVLPMRAEDNCNIQTTASQVLEILALVTQRGARLLFYGGMLKEAVRSAEDPTLIDIYTGWPE